MDEKAIAEAQLRLDMRAAEKMQKEADRKAYWDHYREQLAKAIQHEGGAKRHRIKIRLIKY